MLIKRIFLSIKSVSYHEYSGNERHFKKQTWKLFPNLVRLLFIVSIIGPGYQFLDNSNFKILNFLRRDNWKKSKNRYPGPIIHIIRFEIRSNLSNSFIDFFKMPLISAVSMIMVWFKQYLNCLKFHFPINVIYCR